MYALSSFHFALLSMTSVNWSRSKEETADLHLRTAVTNLNFTVQSNILIYKFQDRRDEHSVVCGHQTHAVNGQHCPNTWESLTVQGSDLTLAAFCTWLPTLPLVLKQINNLSILAGQQVSPKTRSTMCLFTFTCHRTFVHWQQVTTCLTNPVGPEVTPHGHKSLLPLQSSQFIRNFPDYHPPSLTKRRWTCTSPS